MNESMLEIARRAVATALKQGASEAAANAYSAREVEVAWRDGKLEKIAEATTRGMGLQLYVDQRYSSVSTNDLRPQALDEFISKAIALAKALAKDPFRSLPDPELYKGQEEHDLQSEDPAYDQVTAAERRQVAQALEEAARGVEGAKHIVSVTTFCSDSRSESYKVHSNGFEGSRRQTSFWRGADVSVRDPDGRRPEDGDYAGARFYGDLPDPGDHYVRHHLRPIPC